MRLGNQTSPPITTEKTSLLSENSILIVVVMIRSKVKEKRNGICFSPLSSFFSVFTPKHVLQQTDS